MNVDTNYKIKLIGYCSVAEDALLKKFIQAGPSSLVNLKGEYVIAIENQDECYIVTSPYGVCQYYYTVYKDKLIHDDTVIGVLKRSQLPWLWNWKALADLTQLDHVLENDTLHPQIYRVPAGSILHFRGGALKISSLSWEELHPSFPADPEMALTAFNDETRQWIDSNTVVSLSGGLDSRLILSSLLKHGCRPSILTMGHENTTDTIISRKITSALGLPLTVVPLNIEDYLKHGSRIVALTNGTKMACHWHSFVYIQNAGLTPGCIFFIGANGEFARCRYIADKGVVSIAANMLPGLSLSYLWKQRKLTVLFKNEELSGLRPELANGLTEKARDERFREIISLCHNSFLVGLDRFFLEQFVRNFLGNGLKLASANVSWRAPFLNKEWVSTIWNLKRYWKINSNWHRYAIAKNWPQLLDFPEIGRADKTYPKAPLSYWFTFAKKSARVHYADYPEFFRQDVIIEFILENAPLLSELIATDTVVSIVKEHRKNASRMRTMAFLLTMIFWIMKLREVYKK